MVSTPGLPEEIADLIDRTLRAAPVIALNRLLAEFEPTKDSFYVRPARVGAITKAIRSTPPDEFTRFHTPKGRTDFLWAALNHLAPMIDHEELLVAFGRRRGADRNSPSQLEGLWRGVGSRSSVELTPRVREVIARQASVDRGEVLVVHNHPAHDVKSFLRLLFGWKPLPSSQDREVALHYNVEATLRSLQDARGGTLRWYLVDEDRLSGFYLPSLERILSALRFLATNHQVA